MFCEWPWIFPVHKLIRIHKYLPAEPPVSSVMNEKPVSARVVGKEWDVLEGKGTAVLTLTRPGFFRPKF